jgi:hypothetical protein
MGLPYLYNQTFSYAVNIMVNPGSLAFINMYPLIFILLTIAPLIFFSIILALKLSYRIKSLLFFLNAVFSALIPFITNSLINYLSTLQYIYASVLNDLNIYSELLDVMTLVTSINQDIVFAAIALVILNAIFLIYYIGAYIKERQNI